MIISDLNYVEVVTESTEVIGGAGRGRNNNNGNVDVSNETTQVAIANVGGDDSVIIGSPAVALNINSAILGGLSAFS
jgi:hypothetical protein